MPSWRGPLPAKRSAVRIMLNMRSGSSTATTTGPEVRRERGPTVQSPVAVANRTEYFSEHPSVTWAESLAQYDHIPRPSFGTDARQRADWIVSDASRPHPRLGPASTSPPSVAGPPGMRGEILVRDPGSIAFVRRRPVSEISLAKGYAVRSISCRSSTNSPSISESKALAIRIAGLECRIGGRGTTAEPQHNTSASLFG